MNPSALRTLAALALVALIGAGCGNDPAGDAATAGGAGSRAATTRTKALRFSACMREHGVDRFPDPDASGELTLDGVVNGSSLDPGSAAWTEAIAACKDLEPAGFTGHTRTAEQQRHALEFAQCMRDSGVADFPDPARDDPIIDTTRIPSAAGRGARDIPGFDAAVDRCGAALSGQLGVP